MKGCTPAPTDQIHDKRGGGGEAGGGGCEAMHGAVGSLQSSPLLPTMSFPENGLGVEVLLAWTGGIPRARKHSVQVHAGIVVGCLQHQCHTSQMQSSWFGLLLRSCSSSWWSLRSCPGQADAPKHSSTTINSSRRARLPPLSLPNAARWRPAQLGAARQAPQLRPYGQACACQDGDQRVARSVHVQSIGSFMLPLISAWPKIRP